jgi:acetolactate synthase regulatory subunit
MSHSTLRLKIGAYNNRTVLPRCLQILSRRGFRLTTLLTREIRHGEVELHCILEGPSEWHESIPELLNKTVDVLYVEAVQPADHV